MDDTAQETYVSVYEARVPLTPNVIDFKVGMFTANSRLGRAVQAVGTYALPGDTTAIRSPLRSGLYQALTPGGGGGGGRGGLGRRIGRQAERMRCPAGFEFGGRFSDSGLTNCGRQFFESPDGAITGPTRRAMRAGATIREAVGDIANAPEGRSRTIRSLTASGDAVLSRAVNIPDVGAFNKAQQESKIAAAAAEVVNDVDHSTRLVRRDGTILRPVVSIQTLRNARNNPDMEGAAFIASVEDPTKLGAAEVPALLGTNLRSAVWSFPGGGSIRLDKVGDLSTGERRTLTNAFNKATADAEEFDHDAGLRQIASMSNSLSLTTRFPGITKPNERITVQSPKGQQRIVPRWVYHIFLAPSAELRGNKPSWTIVESGTNTKTADQTTMLLDNRSTVSVADGPIQRKSQEAWLASIAYKTSAHVADADFSSYVFQFKRVAADWDPDLPPEGGFRCPPGTRYGGRITDRFGRNCGWNVGRRLANRMEELGRGIGNALDDRRDNRVARGLQGAERGVARQERRIARAQNRIQNAEQRIADIRNIGPDGNPLPAAPGRRERRIARRTEARAANAERALQRRERIANRLDNFADRVDGGYGRRPGGRERVGENVPGGGVASRLDNLADRIDGGYGRRDRREPDTQPGDGEQGPGIATRLDDLADRIDGGAGRRPRDRRGEDAPERPVRPRPQGRPGVNQTVADRILNPNGDNPPNERGPLPNRLRPADLGPNERPPQNGQYGFDAAGAMRRDQQAEARWAGATREEINAEVARLREQRRRMDEARPRPGLREGDAVPDQAAPNAPNVNVPERRPRRDRPRPIRPRDARRRDDPNVGRDRVNEPDQPGSLNPLGDNTDQMMRLNGWDENGNIRDLNDADLNSRIDALAAQERAARQDPDGFDPFRQERRQYLSQLRREKSRRARVANRERDRVGEPDNNAPVNAPDANAPVDVPEADAPTPAQVQEAEAIKQVEQQIGDGNVERIERAEEVLQYPVNVQWVEQHDARFNQIMDDPAMLQQDRDWYRAALQVWDDEKQVALLDEQGRERLMLGRAHLARLEQRLEELNNPAPADAEVFFDDEIGGSMPDARSLRNVDNRFRHRGLPDEAWWRNSSQVDEEGRAQLDRRFGRYYDENNAINTRGRLVNGLLAAQRGERIAPQVIGRPAENPEPKAPAAKAPKPEVASIDSLMVRQIDDMVKSRRNRYDDRFNAIKDNPTDLQQHLREVENSIARRGGEDRLPNETAAEFYNRTEMRRMMSEHRQRVAERVALLNKKAQAAEARRQQEEADGLRDPFNGAAAVAHAERVANQRAKRFKILGKYLDKRYGQDDQPWNDKSRNLSPAEMKSLIRAARGGDAQATARLNQWGKDVYEHAEIEGTEGLKFRTIVDAVAPSADPYDAGVKSLLVQGRIEAFNPDTQAWEKVGVFSRYARPHVKGIYNSYMAMGKDAQIDTDFAESVKNNGFQTVFNPHAFMWAKGGGFEHVKVSAGLTDGPYVWGRVGFRPTNQYEYSHLASVMGQQLQEYRAGRESIIQHADDADMIDALVRRSQALNHDPARAPGHFDYLMALSNRESGKDAIEAREAEVKKWFGRNARFGSGTIDLTDDANVKLDPRGDRQPKADLLAPLHDGRVVRPRDPRRGRIDKATNGLHGGREIVNPNIDTQAKANAHIKRGGSLGEIPNEYWAAALQANSVSKATYDRNGGAGPKRYVKIPKNGGRIGDTYIYVLVGDDGKMTGQGYVVKGATMRDNVNEVIGYNVAADHGILPEGAGWDGRGIAKGGDMRGREVTFVVVPHAFNMTQDGEVKIVSSGDYNYLPSGLRNAPDRGYPEMYAHFLQNYLMRVSDRHAGNGMTMIDAEGRAVVMPIDQGWAGRGIQGAPNYYLARQFNMHRSLHGDIATYASGLDTTERRRFYDRIVGTYDGMLERAERSIAGGKDAFVERMLVGVSPQSRAEAMTHAQTLYDVYKEQTQNMRTHRDDTLRALGYVV